MIWLVGNKGMLGTELSLALGRVGLPFVGSDREVDIVDAGAVDAFAEGKGIRWIVNCAAYTAVDRAEDEPDLCRRLNVDGPRNLAALATRLGAGMLHVSTDYVFEGNASSPYRESDPIGPTGVYGKTKADGEAAVLDACRNAVILRTAWLYGRHGPNFVYTMLRLMRQKEAIGVVADQRGSPTWAADLARAIVAILKRDSTVYGIFHYTDGGETTWYEFAKEIHRLGHEHGILRRECSIAPLRTDQYPTKAKRPAYSVLSKDRIVHEYGIIVPDWKSSLSSYFVELSQDVNALESRIK